MTTYFEIHKNMDCPICGKPLIESKKHNEVACSDSKCRFNSKLIGYINEKCSNCGRVRVELFENGDKVCEKCNWNQDKKEYEIQGRY